MQGQIAAQGVFRAHPTMDKKVCITLCKTLFGTRSHVHEMFVTCELSPYRCPVTGGCTAEAYAFLAPVEFFRASVSSVAEGP